VVAAVARGGRSENGLGVVSDPDGAPSRDGEERVSFYGVDDGHRVPHPLAGVAVAPQLDLLDGMGVGPGDVADDLFRDVIDEFPHLLRREDHVHVGWHRAKNDSAKLIPCEKL